MIYILLFIFIIITYPLSKKKFIFNSNHKSWITSNAYYILVSLIFIIIIGLRGYSVGADTGVYLYHFENLKEMSLTDALLYRSNELGFSILTWIIGKCFNNYSIYLLITAAIYIIPVSILIKKESKSPGLSYFLFFCFGFFTIALSTTRQFIAMGICVAAYLCIKRNPMLSAILIVIASTFHISALIFLPILIVVKLKANKIIIGGMLILTTILYLLKDIIANVYLTYAIKEYSIYEVGGELMILFILLNVLLGLIYYKTFIKPNKGNAILFFIIIIAGIVLFTTRFNLAVMRLFFYYFIFIIIYIPNILFSVEDKMAKTIYRLSYIFVAIYFAIFNTFSDPYSIGSKILPYTFFWQ
jgi:hypothetical protein